MVCCVRGLPEEVIDHEVGGNLDEEQGEHGFAVLVGDEKCEHDCDAKGADSATDDISCPGETGERGDRVRGKMEVQPVAVRDGRADHTGDHERWRDPRIALGLDRGNDAPGEDVVKGSATRITWSDAGEMGGDSASRPQPNTSPRNHQHSCPSKKSISSSLFGQNGSTH